MTRQQIYTTSTQLQYHIREAIYACHTQNHDRVVRILATVINVLVQRLEEVFADISYYNQEIELVNLEAINLSLQDILAAQENKDYVLLADLLELRLVPFLQSLQEAIRSYDGVDTDSEIWKNNMSALKEHDKSLWKQLNAYHERYERETAAGTWQMNHHLEATNTGAFTLAGQDGNGMYYYHSNISPEGEAADFARYYYTIECPSYVVWGLGLGYHIHELFRLDDGIRIQVFESNLDVIYHCLMAVDSSVLLNDFNFELIYDPDFKKVISVLDEGTENFIIHNPSLRHIKDARIKEQMEMFFIRDSGKRNAAILFENNSRENFKHYDGYADELRPEFEGKDVIIVAAGPSLDKNVELLKNKRPNMVILAVETVFRKLLNLGIDVDYMIVTDANSRIYWHLEGLESRQVPMLYLSTAYKGYAMNYQGKKYLICQNGYKKAEELAKQKGWHLYETGGSVTTTAFDVCIRLGCKSIAFIGLDLAYTGNLAHAEGAAKRAAAGAEEMQQVPAVGGGKVPASKVFIMYNRWIAERAKKEDVVMPVIDATEGGAVIPGLKMMLFQSYLEEIAKV
ncbi:MAG: motility associated factor glycosyltransferase family protein [Lachnospiraceae bacterium]|nr:motility associated factor glycosyltransferase family protein [Lachnospiraceae bacterium]